MQTIYAQKREILGKKVKNLRKDGFIPAVIYGKNMNSTSVSVKENEFVKIWKSAGESSILNLEIDGKKENVLIHDVAFDPIKDNPIHVDFLAIEMDKPIKVGVKIEFMGESPAVKLGGTLIKIMHELQVEALPKDLPHEISVDISQLVEMGSSIKVEDIQMQNVKILNNPSDIMVLVEAPKTEEELKAEEEAIAGASIETIEVIGKKEKETEKEAQNTETQNTKKEV